MKYVNRNKRIFGGHKADGNATFCKISTIDATVISMVVDRSRKTTIKKNNSPVDYCKSSLLQLPVLSPSLMRNDEKQLTDSEDNQKQL